MNVLNKDIIFEVGHYLCSYDLKNLKFAFPELDVERIYVKKKKVEDEIIENYSSVNIFEYIIVLLESELVNCFCIHSLQDRITKYNVYQADISLSICKSLLKKFFKNKIIDKSDYMNDDHLEEFWCGSKTATYHIWIKNSDDIKQLLKMI